jgi:hypothetical protein
MSKGMVEVTGVWIRNISTLDDPLDRTTEVLIEVGGSWRKVKRYMPGGVSEIIEIPRSMADLERRFPLDNP